MVHPIFSDQFYKSGCFPDDVNSFALRRKTLTLVESREFKLLSLRGKIVNYFVPQCNKELLEACKKLQDIYDQIGTKSDLDRQLTQEVRNKGINASYSLCASIFVISMWIKKRTENEEKKSHLVLSIVNLVRKLFGYSRIHLPIYPPIDSREWQKRLDGLRNTAFKPQG